MREQRKNRRRRTVMREHYRAHENIKFFINKWYNNDQPIPISTYVDEEGKTIQGLYDRITAFKEAKTKDKIFDDSYGIKGRSYLTWLPKFDIVLDSCIDVMHVIDGCIKIHLIKLFTGARMKKITANAIKGQPYPDGIDMDTWMEHQQRGVLSEKQKADVEMLYKNLKAPTGIAPPTLPPFTRTG
jgi:hypothetical protein